MSTTPIETVFLDCTLRDGGYYNDWDFDLGLVNRYLAAVAAAGVDIVELGFRIPPDNVFRGPFAYTTDALISQLDVPSGLTLCVMSNAGDFRDAEVMERYFDVLYPPAGESQVEVVRIATHVAEVAVAADMARRLAGKGYRVGVNLMQVSRLPLDEVQAAARLLRETCAVEVLYFADSLGNMRRDDVIRTTQTLASEWSGPLGFHAHDNKRLALGNCLAAAEAGCTWIDATIRGMGRGAGNAQTEFLLGELAQVGFGGPYDPGALVHCVMDDFAALQRRYDWGANLLYVVAADRDIHPTYVQELLSESRYELADITLAVAALSDVASHSFSTRSLSAALAGDGSSYEGAWSAEGWCQDRPALLLATGPKGMTHLDGIRQYIDRAKPLVLCLNMVSPVGDDLVDAFVACHPTRLAMEASRITSVVVPLLVPTKMLEAVGLDRSGPMLDYGLSVKSGSLNVAGRGCEIPELLSLAYAAAAAIAGGATQILLAGFDGYAAGDARQESTARVFEMLERVAPHVPVISLTPTTHPVRQGSVYAPAT